MAANVARFMDKIAGKRPSVTSLEGNNNDNNNDAQDNEKWAPASALGDLKLEPGSGLTPPVGRLPIDMDKVLFDPSLVSDTNLASHLDTQLKPVPEELYLRPLRRRDFEKGYLELLAQLTDVGVVDQALFEKRFDVIAQKPLAYYIIVMEDLSRGKIVASISMVLEWKFIHSASFRGRIEDVVVCDSMRGKGLGRILCERATALGRKLGCYKMSLECKDHLLAFYNRFGFVKDPGNNFMVVRFDKEPSASL